MSLLRNALQTRKQQQKKGISSESPSAQQSESGTEPLTFSGPVLDADDILGHSDSDALSSAAEVSDATVGAVGELEAALDLINDARQDAVNTGPADAGLEYCIDGVEPESNSSIKALEENDYPGQSVSVVEQPGDWQAAQEQTAQEQVAREQAAREHRATEQQQLPSAAGHTDTAETQAAGTGNRLSAASGMLYKSGLSKTGSGMNLDPLFFIIIAFACAGLFGSLYALVTQNDAFVSAEYADLRAQQASLDDIAVTLRATGNDNTPESVDRVAGSDKNSGSEMTSSDVSGASNQAGSASPAAENAEVNAALNASANAAVDDSTDSELSDASRADGQAVIDESAAAAQETTRTDSDAPAKLPNTATEDSTDGTVSTANAATTATTTNNTNAVAPARPADDGQSEIALLRQQLVELKQSLATQDTKISALLSNKTEARAPEHQSSQIPIRSPGDNASIATNTTASSTVALDKAGDVIVVENQSGDNTDNAVVVGRGSESGVTSQLSKTISDPAGQNGTLDGVGRSAFAASGVQEIRLQAHDAVVPQTDLPQVDFPQLSGKAFHAYSTGDFNQAGALYRRALQLDPYNRDANLGVAAVAVKGGNYAVAVQRYRHLLSLNPDDALAFSSLLGLAGITRDSALENELVVHTSQYRHIPALHAALGNHYSQTARWSEAVRAYSSAVGLAPETADYLYNLAVSLDNLGDTQAAVETYQRALTLSEVGNHTFSRVDATARVQALQQSR